MKRRIQIVIALFGLFLITAGSALIMKNSRVNEEYNYYPSGEEAVLQTNTQNTPNPDNASQGVGYPVRIEVVNADINVSVAKGYYNKQTGKWTLSKNNAHYAVMTPRPNSIGGNTFIYGHNRSSVFARLLKVKPGSVAYVTTDNNQRFVYKLTRSFTTNPQDSSILNYQGAPILTLQTCSGANFQNRTLFVFELVGVTNA